jgi:hypothetical protein
LPPPPASTHAVWLESGGTYTYLQGVGSLTLAAAVNNQVTLGFKPVAFISKYLHAVWLTKNKTFTLYAPGSAATNTVTSGLNARITSGETVEAFAGGAMQHTAWLQLGSVYQLRQSASGYTLSTMVNQDVAAGWKVVALISRDNYSAWLHNGLCL